MGVANSMCAPFLHLIHIYPEVMRRDYIWYIPQPLSFNLSAWTFCWNHLIWKPLNTQCAQFLMDLSNHWKQIFWSFLISTFESIRAIEKLVKYGHNRHKGHFFKVIHLLKPLMDPFFEELQVQYLCWLMNCLGVCYMHPDLGVRWSSKGIPLQRLLKPNAPLSNTCDCMQFVSS